MTIREIMAGLEPDECVDIYVEIEGGDSDGIALYPMKLTEEGGTGLRQDSRPRL